MLPTIAPPEMLAMAALGILLGLTWQRRLHLGVALPALGLALGVLLAQSGVNVESFDTGLLGAAFLAAAVAAVIPTVPPAFGGILSWGGALLVGMVIAPRQADAVTIGVASAACGAILVATMGGARLLQLQSARPWMAIGARVLAAWVAAIALLMLSIDLSGFAVTSR